MIFKLKFGRGNLFSPAMTSTIERNNSVGSLLEPLLKKVTPIVGLRMLWSSTLVETTSKKKDWQEQKCSRKHK
jgi:hypothetical protein